MPVCYRYIDTVYIFYGRLGSMSDKRKASAAQMRATAKYEKNNYFKTLVRFPADKEDAIRAAAGDSLNGFIVAAVLEKVNASGSIQ
jgi:hypothetical protein